MIPLKLNIRNFLSYRENVPTLDFTGIHVACLCGENGHGKSALLDAITWCLWGKARGQVQDDLISFGADEARVELEFMARDSRFRVIRSRARAGGRRRQGASDLQLQAIGDDYDNVQVASGNTLRETQRKIEQLVGMDYDTFINSAFLLQGRADEFTNKTPAERKAVLASILGLEAYERFQTRAREQMTEKRTAAARLEGSFSQIELEIGEIGDPSTELNGVARNLDEVSLQLAQRRREAEELREQVSRLESQSAALAELQRQIRGITQEIAQVESGMTTSESRVRECQSLISQAEGIRNGIDRLEKSRERFDVLEDSRQRSEVLRQEQNFLSNSIENQRVRLETEVEQMRRRIEQDLAPKVQSEATLFEAQEETRNQLNRLAVPEEQLRAQRNRLQVLAAGIGEAKTTAERYKAEGKQIQEKLNLLETSDPDATVCPLCETPLDQDGCRRLTETYKVEIEQKRDLYRTNRRSLQDLEKEKADLESDLPRQEQALTQAGNELRDRLAQLERQFQESEHARQELDRLQNQLSATVTALESESFAQDEPGQLRQVSRQLDELAYDEASYQQSYRLIQDLQHFPGLQSQLDQAITRLPEEEAALAQSQDMVRRRRSELDEYREHLRLGQEAVTQLPLLQAQQRQLGQDLNRLEVSQQAAIARKGLLEGQLKRLEYLREELGRGSQRMALLQEEAGIYQDLYNAFGRQGIQAMLIETVVPRLEEEANLLLGRMTDNRMHVKLETQRERRTPRASGAGGDPVETLEINVSDELGLRSYEMYSGGEAFRVNLALRIALSRVLSQRTGAPLPTLFIDEGFGTQDTSGRERILDVISSIEDDFDKIIVITHLDDLKDMFPVRIEVQKDHNGSTFWLS